MKTGLKTYSMFWGKNKNVNQTQGSWFELLYSTTDVLQQLWDQLGGDSPICARLCLASLSSFSHRVFLQSSFLLFLLLPMCTTASDTIHLDTLKWCQYQAHFYILCVVHGMVLARAGGDGQSWWFQDLLWLHLDKMQYLLPLWNY